MSNNEIFIIGLGNPGKVYTNSRHNIGFLLLEKLKEKNKILKKFQDNTIKNT